MTERIEAFDKAARDIEDYNLENPLEVDRDVLIQWIVTNILEDLEDDDLNGIYVWIMDPYPDYSASDTFIKTFKTGTRATAMMNSWGYRKIADLQSGIFLNREKIEKLNDMLGGNLNKSDRVIERSKLNKSMRYDIMNRDDFHCVLCGATGKDDRLVIDHIVPISKGGKTELDNLQTLCRSCNLGKRDKLISDETTEERPF